MGEIAGLANVYYVLYSNKGAETQCEEIAPYSKQWEKQIMRSGQEVLLVEGGSVHMGPRGVLGSD